MNDSEIVLSQVYPSLPLALLLSQPGEAREQRAGSFSLFGGGASPGGLGDAAADDDADATPLHVASRYAMTTLLVLFLERGGARKRERERGRARARSPGTHASGPIHSRSSASSVAAGSTPSAPALLCAANVIMRHRCASSSSHERSGGVSETSGAVSRWTVSTLRPPSPPAECSSESAPGEKRTSTRKRPRSRGSLA